MPSGTVLFSVRPWVRKSGTSEPLAPGMRLRAFQYSEPWSSSPACSAQLPPRHTGSLSELAL